MNINQKIKKYIDDHNLKQSSIAKNMGINTVAFNMIVNNKQNLKAEDLIGFCKAVNENVDYIIRYGDEN